MKTAKIVSVWSGLVLGSMVYGMTFQQGDRVKLLDGSGKGEIAEVQCSFSKMWPGAKISTCTKMSLVAAYLATIPSVYCAGHSTSKRNPFHTEKYIYYVRIGGETFLTHQSWMRKVPAHATNAKKKSEQEKTTTAAASATATAAKK